MPLQTMRRLGVLPLRVHRQRRHVPSRFQRTCCGRRRRQVPAPPRRQQAAASLAAA